jgi:predicted XRE-type DNA-binding protein
MPEGTAAPPIDTPPPSARLTIPASQVARIRIWMKHGMTVSQVSEVFGVPISEVERVLRQAGRG